MGGYLGMCCVMRVFCLIPCFLATHLFLIGNPWASRYGKIHNVFLFPMPFLKTCILWMWNLKFFPNKEMFDHCLKLKFKSRTQVVWWNASSEYWTYLLRCFWPMQLIAPIVKFLLLISKKKNLFDYFCFSCVFKI